MKNLSIILPALVLLVIGVGAYIVVLKITTQPPILVSAKPQATAPQSSSSAQATSSADIKTTVIPPDSNTVKQWQQEADSGKAGWRLDPTSTAKELSSDYGFLTTDQFSATTSGQNQNMTVQAQHNGKTYIFTMYQPGVAGPKGVWAIKSIAQE